MRKFPHMQRIFWTSFAVSIFQPSLIIKHPSIMKSANYLLGITLSMVLVCLFSSCNDSTQTATEEPKQTEDTTAATPPPPVAFTPFDVVEISHSVKDYAKWRPAFDDDSTARKASGMEFMVMGRNMANPKDLLVVLTAADVQKAKSFTVDPRLKDVMEKAGVNSKPDIQLWHVIRMKPDPTENNWVTITHKVKDFDAWLKVFDEEGTTTRGEQGLIDVALARGIDDPNLVHLVFDIKETDVTKAKAAISSDEKKQLMTKAGVQGAPKINYYTTVE